MTLAANVGSLAATLGRRLLRALLVMLISASMGFVVLSLIPGDGLAVSDESSLAGAASRAQSIAAERTRLGLDRPLYERYLQYGGQLLRGDMGVSFAEARPVSDVLSPALFNSAVLCGSSLIAAILVGGAVGVAHGWRPRSSTARVASSLLTAVYSAPEFIVAVLLISILAYKAGLFPVGGIVDPVTGIVGTTSQRFVDRLQHLVLPVITLSIGWAAIVARQQRAALVEIRDAAFIRTANAKGLSPASVLFVHALRPSLPGTLAVVGNLLPTVVGGAVVVEAIYAWPGMGTLMLRAIGSRDFPILAGAIVVIGFAVSLSSLLVDMVAIIADPRQRTVTA